MTAFAALPFLPDAVIFDMDGLMIDSERVSLACWSQAADEFGLGLDEAVFLRMVGLGDRDTHALLRAQGIEDSVIEAVAAQASRSAREMSLRRPFTDIWCCRSHWFVRSRAHVTS